MVIACTRDCYDTCIFDENYRPVREFPTSGFTCSRGLSDLKRNEVNRVQGAYIEGKEVSVEEAVKYVAKRLREVTRERVIHVEYDGNQGLLTWYFPARLWNSMGTASTDYSICSLEGHEGIKAHYGSSLGALPEEMQKYSGVVFWGSEAVYSFIHGWKLFKDKYKITIDVRMSETAKRSERAYVIAPGSDAHLALALMKVLLEEGRVKGSLVDVSALRRRLEAFDLESLIHTTGLGEEEVRELAQLYAYYEPLTVIGFAIGRTYNGGYAAGLISMIPALLGMERGFFYSNSQGWGIDFSYLRGTHVRKPSKVVGMGEVGSRISEFDFMFVWNSNPVITLPGGNRIAEAVEDGELFLVVHDPFWTETAKVANVVIPAPTFLEKEDVIYSYWHPYLVYNTPVRPKRGVTEVELMILLAKEMELSGLLLEEDPWSAVDVALRGTGVTLQELRSKGVVKVNPQARKGKVSVDPFPTPQELTLPQGRVLVYSAHPNYTNSQFSEIYGRRRAVVYTRDLEGEGYLEGPAGRVKVKFVRGEVGERVLFLFKSDLVDLEGRSVNSILSPVKGKFGGPRLNDEVQVRLPRGDGEPSPP